MSIMFQSIMNMVIIIGESGAHPNRPTKDVCLILDEPIKT